MELRLSDIDEGGTEPDIEFLMLTASDRTASSRRSLGLEAPLTDADREAMYKNHGVAPRPDKPLPSRSIPKSVRNAVWRRDQGRCVECGSQERLEFDHIISFSMGGSNTERNTQLLCEKCNRSKGAAL